MPVFFPLYGEVGSSLLRFNPATISRPLRTSTSRLFLVLFAGLSLSGYLLGRCVRMASGHPSPHCPVSGTFAAGVLLSSLGVSCPAPSLPEFSSPPLIVLCARVSRARFPSSFISPALNAGFPYLLFPISSPPLIVLCARVPRARFPSSFVHCAGCHPAF